MIFDRLMQLRSWCDEFAVDFKLNTVVNALNFCEDMNVQVAALEPQRWKIFQVAPAFNENYGPGAPKGLDFASFAISAEEFASFLSRLEPRLSSVMVPETNEQVDGADLLLTRTCASRCLRMGTALPPHHAASLRLELRRLSWKCALTPANAYDALVQGCGKPQQRHRSNGWSRRNGVRCP